MSGAKTNVGAATVDTDVLVVGAGPAGLTAGALLAREGVRAITISKYAGPAHTPRAHITNQRTMEVMRDLGIEEQVRRVALPAENMRDTVWATSVAGRELARVRSWGAPPHRKGEYEASSPSAMCNIGQHELEPIIVQGALGFGADLRFNTELVEITQTADAAHAIVRGPDPGQSYTIRARYVIAADGGRSTVAEQTGFTYDGEPASVFALNAWFEADLTRYQAHRPGALFFAMDLSSGNWLGAGTLITVRPWNEFVAVLSYDPADERFGLSEAAIVKRLQAIIGDPEVDIELKGINPWEVNFQLAQEYRRGRVFLVGDAAHRHSPANGLGSNTSVQDSYNLAWKLAYVLQGRAGEALLDSYHAERHPVGEQVLARSRATTDLAAQIAPLFVARQPGADALEELSTDSDVGRSRRHALGELLSQHEKYHLNAHGVELGQRYASIGVISEGADRPQVPEDADMNHAPTTFPGAYLPHAWVLHERRLVSTLDLVGDGRFALITGIGGESWLRAAERLSEELGVALVGRSVGTGLEYDDVYRDWAGVREVDDRGCVLVRPDRYVAWRSVDRPEDAGRVLGDVLRRILALGPGSQAHQAAEPDHGLVWTR
jgi:2,4-dichlorophenol 6-monooxygenase